MVCLFGDALLPSHRLICLSFLMGHRVIFLSRPTRITKFLACTAFIHNNNLNKCKQHNHQPMVKSKPASWFIQQLKIKNIKIKNGLLWWRSFWKWIYWVYWLSRLLTIFLQFNSIKLSNCWNVDQFQWFDGSKSNNCTTGTITLESIVVKYGMLGITKIGAIQAKTKITKKEHIC